MARSLRQFLDGRRTLPPTLVILFICSLLPARWLAWEVWFAELAQTLVAPIMNSAVAFSHAVRPPAARQPSSPELDKLKADAATALFMLTQEQQENQRLRGMIRDLQQGVELASDPSLRLVNASVIGRDADLARLVLHVRAGGAQGVTEGSVAVADGAQLVGRVQTVGPKVSSVLLITDRSAGRIRGRVMVEGAPGSVGVECDLEPDQASAGTLRGRLAAPDLRAGEQAQEVKVGQLVRLSDATWPKNAQMLELGTVESVETNPEQPIRKIITVRPRFDLSRASEVYLRVIGDPDAETPNRGGR